ncbi:NAD(P)/FAD-dependent oxidoreductase [Arenimonas terrae]|uniref:NAD(P)/FAD-dependent oxidoreductase n=1 Tax=Arenimonas terrae TaxID=2546226 RepID=UPI00159EF4DD|nr:FAD-dependent oxidoreductase [Arenimonas terrae]
MNEGDADVLILGGGVIGLACAHYLLAEGRSVRLLELGTVGGGASWGNCGTLTPSHAPPLAAPGMVGQALRWMLSPSAPLYIKPRWDPTLMRWLLTVAGRCNARDWRASGLAKGALLRYSRALVEELVTGQGLDCGFEAGGFHYVFRSERALRRQQRDLPLLAELGIEARLLDGAALAADEPALKPGMAGALFFPGDAQLRPDRYTAELARIVRAAGGVIEEGVRVTGLERGRHGIEAVQTSEGRRRAGRVLVAMGAWSPEFARMIRLPIPIQPGKGYSITYDRPGLAPRRPLVLKERSVCVTAWEDGFRLGSTMEFSGYDDRLNRTRLDALERGAGEYLHEPVGPVKRHEWCGWRPMTTDDLPLLGRAPGHNNLWLATGHGMMGVGMSAGTGRLVADLMLGREPAVDPAPYAPARFAR